MTIQIHPKPEFWNAAKQELKAVYFDQMDFTIAQRNAVEQGLMVLKNFVEREIGLNNANGHTFSRESLARRSGCTNMFKVGIPTIEIMKISGHQTEREFLQYILIDEEETAERLSVHPYFNQPVERLAENPAGQKLPVELHHLLDFSSN